MNFKLWLEENQDKKILLLIHPEIIYEVGWKEAQTYNKELIKHAKNFDYIITHHLGPDENWTDHREILPKEQKQAYKLIFNTAKNISHSPMYKHDDYYGCSYDKELPDFLIENPNSTVFFGGGYKRNCVQIAYQQLFNRLDWLIKDTNTKIEMYEPLLINPNTHT